ncbi:MAG: META domain-containing protein [Candidatus Rariloculaceae bacterium]
MIDRNGNDIVSSLNYDLSPTNEFIATELQLEMIGMYQYMADAARFTECLSGRSFPVAFEAEGIELERAYLELRRQPGDSLLASFRGRVAMRPRMEGDGQELNVVVEDFGGVWPAETCGARQSMSELHGTNWVLTRLGGHPVIANANSRPPRLMLSSSENNASGFSGCNNFSGGYEIDGSSISFGPLAVTMMACSEGGDTESAFLDARGSTTSWRRIRHHLELYDVNGEMTARLEARHLD